MSTYYILRGKEVVKVNSVMKWAKYMEEENRLLFQEDVGNYWVSTVFLGLDYNFDFSIEPLIFETMVFIRDAEGVVNYSEVYLDRYSNYEETKKGHKKAVKITKEVINGKTTFEEE